MLKAQARLDQATAAELDSPPLTQDSESQQLPNWAQPQNPRLLDQALTWLQTETLRLHHLHGTALGPLQGLGILQLVQTEMHQRLFSQRCYSWQPPQLADCLPAELLRLPECEHLQFPLPVCIKPHGQQETLSSRQHSCANPVIQPHQTILLSTLSESIS